MAYPVVADHLLHIVKRSALLASDTADADANAHIDTPFK
jgi:hypothetical protein